VAGPFGGRPPRRSAGRRRTRRSPRPGVPGRPRRWGLLVRTPAPVGSVGPSRRDAALCSGRTTGAARARRRAAPERLDVWCRARRRWCRGTTSRVRGPARRSSRWVGFGGDR